MKKILALALTLMMVLSLAACGGGGNDPKPSGNDTPGTSQQEEPSNTTDESQSADVAETPDLSTIQGLFDYYGIDADTMKPDSFVEFKAINLENRYKEIQISFTEDFSMELYKTLGAALFNSTQSASDDGKCYKIITNEALSPEDANTNGYGSGWWYIRNGEKLEVHLSKDTDDDYKDIIIIGLTDYDL